MEPETLSKGDSAAEDKSSSGEGCETLGDEAYNGETEEVEEREEEEEEDEEAGAWSRPAMKERKL